MHIVNDTAERDVEPCAVDAASQRISVIIPARNEEQVLPLTLPAILDAVDRLPASADVIVVVPRSSPVLQVPPVRDERLRWHGVANSAKYHAILAGVGLSDSEVVLLLDADVVTEPTTLERLAQPLLEGRADVSAGRIQLLRRPGRPGNDTLARWADISFDAWDRLRRNHPNQRWALPGGVYGIRRSLLPAVPLVPVVDDASVGLHARDMGATFHYEPTAVVGTQPPSTYAQWVRQKLRARRGWALLARSRPGDVARFHETFRTCLAAAASIDGTRHLMYAQDRILRAWAYGSARLRPSPSGLWTPERTEVEWSD